jgi:hypothetical protein
VPVLPVWRATHPVPPLARCVTRPRKSIAKFGRTGRRYGLLGVRHRKIPRARAPGTAPIRSAWRKESPCAGAPTQGSRRRKLPDARCALRPSSRRGCGSTGSIVPLIFRAIARDPGPSAECLHGDASGPRGRRIAAPRCRRKLTTLNGRAGAGRDPALPTAKATAGCGVLFRGRSHE